jgi:hypothetical protein
MEVTGQLYSTFTLFQGKESLVPAGQEAERIPELVWMLWRIEKSLAPAAK